MRVRKPFTVAAMVFVLGVLVTTRTTFAQGASNTIVQLLQSIQSTLNGLVTTVGTIDTRTAPRRVLFTPSLTSVTPDLFICAATNVISEARNVKVQILGDFGVVLATAPVFLEPGRTMRLGLSGQPQETTAYCRIEVSNGVTSDVRGVLALFDPATHRDHDPVAAQ